MSASPSPAVIILASTSRYRAELLARLGLPFQVDAPDVDETARAGETPAALAARLALSKAQAVAARHPQAWVLGSDQVCACDGRLLGKPGSRERAEAQLAQLAGRATQFHTAVALVHGTNVLQDADVTTVRMRALTPTEIGRYLDAEPALDCAGSFKCEGLGISLCDAIETRDPTALVGLPLILVRQLLAEAGLPRP